jgi:MinD-like ATPase involved in chromosome partitioning or flagellar assembly/CheY-like chemotaxis protein
VPERLKVLLIEDHPGTADAVKRMLAVAEAPAVSITLEWADSLEKALARLDATPFDAVLLDLNLPDSRGLQTVSRLLPHRGNAALIVWTASEDQDLAFAALREGAEESLVKGDVNGPALIRRLRLAVERRQFKTLEDAADARSVVLGFSGVKGGAGTTTMALNVAAALAKKARRTIAIELQPCGGMFSYQLKHAPAAHLSSLNALGADHLDEAALGAALCTLPLGLRVLFGPQRPEEFGDLDPTWVEALIRTASRMAESVVIDLPSGNLASPMLRTAVRQCHFVTMVLERDPTGLYAAKRFLELLHSWGISQLITGAVVVNRTMALTPMVIGEISAQLACATLGAIPPAAELCARGHQAGSPVVFLEPDCTFSSTVIELTQRLFEQPSLRRGAAG